jgi:hypothetical protein
VNLSGVDQGDLACTHETVIAAGSEAVAGPCSINPTA